jgi:hypothetical protein
VGLRGALAAVHEFSFEQRRQARRADLRIHRAKLGADAVQQLDGLWVTRPARTISDLVSAWEDADALGQVAIDALRAGAVAESEVANALAPMVKRFGKPGENEIGLSAGRIGLTESASTPCSGWVSESDLALVESFH